MAKKLLAILSAAVILAVAVVGMSLPASAAETTFQVGYARVDINPYVVDGDFSSGIMALPLRGTGDVWNRLSSTMVDDNGDGVIDENDGLKVTCIAVSDADGKTVLFITIDLIGGGLYNTISKAIVNRVDAAVASGELSNVSLTKEQIVYAGTHTHNAPDTTVYKSNGYNETNDDGVDLSVVNENLGAWIDRTVEDVGDAAILALKDRAAATLTKDQIAVSEATTDAVVGKVMNSTRHYKDVDKNGETVGSGDNFNAFSTPTYVTTRGDDPQQVTEADDTMYLMHFKFADSSKLPIIMAGWRGHPSLNNSDSYTNSGRTCLSSDFVNAFRHGLEYGCQVTTNKENATGYVESWTLGTTQKYRAAYFQGNGGNVNPRGYELLKDSAGNTLTYVDDNGNTVLAKAFSWIDLSGDKAEIKGRACSYGVVLAALAQEGVEDGKNETQTTAGSIMTMKSLFHSQRKLDGVNDLSYAAANAYKTAVALQSAANTTYTKAYSAYNSYLSAQDTYDRAIIKIKYLEARNKAKTAYETAMTAHKEALTAYVTFMEANSTNNPVTKATATVDYATPPDKPVLSLPFVYKDADGNIFAIASKYHANAVIADWNKVLDAPLTTGTDITLYSILLGKDTAFVVVPGEPFDYYYSQDGVYTADKNLWNILDNDATYGKPFVFGYANGSSGYFPNSEAYTYNTGSTKYAVGSYEVHTSNFIQGTGENMIRTFDMMLDCMEAESRTADCRHCGKSVTWEPYRGQTPILADAHYYLPCDFSGDQVLIGNGTGTAAAHVCFDLNGYTLTGATRAFYVYGGSTLSIMDTPEGQTGVAQGCGGSIPAGFGGGALSVQKGAVCNFYSGTLQQYAKEESGTATGGAVQVYGTFNMYGGTINGGTVSSFSGRYLSGSSEKTATRTAMGGAVYVSSGTFNIYGGQIYPGTAQKIVGEVVSNDNGTAYRQTVTATTCSSPCVGVSTTAEVVLGGNAKVDNIYFYGGTAGLTVKGDFTGSTELAYPSSAKLEEGTDIGAAIASDGVDADVSGATITVKGSELTVAVKDADLVLSASAYKQVYCQACKSYQRWKPVKDGDFDTNAESRGLKAGHYILKGNISDNQLQLNYNTQTAVNTFCFDLAGFRYTGASRSMYVYKNGILNIQDSKGGGTVKGGSDSARSGGTLFGDPGSVINVYSGTIQARAVSYGGAVFSYGTFNLYGGTVEGGKVTYDGGAIRLSKGSSSPAGTVNLYGGKVTAGTATRNGNCIQVEEGTITIGGTVQVNEIWFTTSSASSFTVDTSDQPFTGSAVLTHKTKPTNGTDIGNFVAGKGMDASGITLNGSNLKVAIDGTNLIAAEETVSVYANDKVFGQYVTMNAALNAYTYDESTRNYIKLTASTAEAVTISKNVYLDLNGFDMTGAITVEDGATLYCMDTKTDDYTIADGDYGVITGIVTGKITGVPVETVGTKEAGGSHRAGYLKITKTAQTAQAAEEFAVKEGISFHRVNLQIRSMTLRPACVGVYYKSNFRGDEAVAGAVDQYGVALSVAGDPVLEGSGLNCAFSSFEEFAAGAGGNVSTGTLLSGIMKTDADNNDDRAGMDVYGCAYIQTEDGIMQGVTVTRTLKEQVVAINNIWDTLSDKQKTNMLQMYESYKTTMENWEGIDAIKAAATPETTE